MSSQAKPVHEIFCKNNPFCANYIQIEFFFSLFFEKFKNRSAFKLEELCKVRENCHFLDHQPTPMSLGNIKMAPSPSRLFLLFCVQIMIMSSNQKSTSQIFDICCKNISFSPDFSCRRFGVRARNIYIHSILFNFNLKNRTLSNLSSLES